MAAIIDKIRHEPAVVIGVIAAVILAVVQTLGGHDILSGSVVDWFTRALDPNTGWLIPVILGIITRFFVTSNASHAEQVTTALYTPPPTTDGGLG